MSKRDSQPQPDLFATPAETRAFAKKRAKTETPNPIIAKTPQPAPPPNALLNVREAAMRLRLSKSTLDKLRCVGKGPPFVKTTDRAVRYNPTDLDVWLVKRRRNSTKD